MNGSGSVIIPGQQSTPALQISYLIPCSENTRLVLLHARQVTMSPGYRVKIKRA